MGAPHLLYLLLHAPALAVGKLEIPTMQIAPGVHMPVAPIGTGGTIDPLRPEDVTIMVTNWLDQGGVGIDTAVNYKNQDLIGKAIANSSVDRKELFITSKVNGC